MQAHDDPESLPILNQEILGSLCEALEEAAAEVIHEYLKDTPRLLAEMDAALGSGDLQQVAGLAHQIKSSSGALGGERSQALARLVEENAKTGTDDNLADHCARLQTTTNALLTRLRAHLDNS